MRKKVVNNDNLEKIINSNSMLKDKPGEQRGAKVFGYSLCPEVYSYLEDSNPEINARHLLTMAFAGNGSPVPIPSIYSDMDSDDLE